MKYLFILSLVFMPYLIPMNGFSNLQNNYASRMDNIEKARVDADNVAIELDNDRLGAFSQPSNNLPSTNQSRKAQI